MKIKEDENIEVPKLGLRFLNWFCSDSFIDEVEGDLIQKYNDRKQTHSRFINAVIFWLETLGFFRPTFIRKNLFKIDFWGLTMFRSNLKFAVRNIYKNFFFSAINITGLAIGLSFSILISKGFGNRVN